MRLAVERAQETARSVLAAVDDVDTCGPGTRQGGGDQDPCIEARILERSWQIYGSRNLDSWQDTNLGFHKDASRELWIVGWIVSRTGV